MMDARCDWISQVTLSGCSALRHCAPPSAEYFLEADCDAIPAGETCAARCAQSQCLSGGPVVFRCAVAKNSHAFIGVS